MLMSSGHAGLVLDPVQVVLGPGEAGGQADLAASGGTEGDDTDL